MFFYERCTNWTVCLGLLAADISSSLPSISSSWSSSLLTGLPRSLRFPSNRTIVVSIWSWTLCPVANSLRTSGESASLGIIIFVLRQLSLPLPVMCLFSLFSLQLLLLTSWHWFHHSFIDIFSILFLSLFCVPSIYFRTFYSKFSVRQGAGGKVICDMHRACLHAGRIRKHVFCE